MQEESATEVETGNEERIFDQLHRSLSFLEADYRRTLEAEADRQRTNGTHVSHEFFPLE